MSPTRPSYIDHDGFLMPMGFPVAHFESALRYRTRPGDVVISAYPKCGTTWTQHIVYLILHGGEPVPADQTLTELVPHLEEMGLAFVEGLPEPRCIKIHLPVSMTSWHEDARYIYVARNPFDCCVSFFHHTRGFAKHYDFADGTFDDFFECFLAGEVDFGDYFDNLVPWYGRRADANVLFVTYEQMQADPRRAVTAIGEFIGQTRVLRDPEILDSIVRHSSFDSMKKDQLRWASRRPDDLPFIRKGQVGDWMNYFSRDQARRLADKFADRAAGTDLEQLWPEVLESARAPGGL